MDEGSATVDGEPDELKTEDVRVERTADEIKLRAKILSERAGDEGFAFECSFRGVDEDHELLVGDALVAFLLLPAMACNETLDLTGLTVSRRLLEALSELQDLYYTWTEGLSRIDVKAEPVSREADERGTGLFFSGGLDSWYSALTAGSEGHKPTHLFFLVGFDIDERHSNRVNAATETAVRAARELNARLIVCCSNIRKFSDPLVQWGLYHGSYLAGVGLALGSSITRCYIPASNSPDALRQWGSHPHLDALWTTESLEFAHAGFEANRWEKIRRVAQSDTALSTLRVCWQPVDEYNCGHCPKCSLMMAGLKLVDKLEDAPTFPSEIDLRALARVDSTRSGERRATINAMLPVAIEQGEFAIARALKKALRPKYLRPARYMEVARRSIRRESRPTARLR